MTSGDQQHPLGAPANRPSTAEGPERWEAVSPDKPHIQRSTRTGMFRNTRPTPVEAPFVFHYFGVPVPKP